MTVDSREVVTLANGARVVLDPMPRMRTASVGVWLGVGARDEPEALNGLAHLLEHMAFKGARGLDARGLAEHVENCGAHMNASTDYERTGYFVRCMAADSADMLDLALSVALSADLPESELAREKDVVLQEIGEASDQPDDLVFDLVQSAAWPGHALGRPILGREDTLDAIRREDLTAFVRDRYVGGRAVVSVAGAFDRDAILAAAEPHLVRLGQSAPERTAGPPWGSGAACVSRKLEQSHIVMSLPAPGSRAPKRFAARILAEILGGGMASRLYQTVREERGLAYTIDCACEEHTDAGRFDVYFGCDSGRAAEALDLIGGVWDDLAGQGPSDAELARAKAVAVAQLAMSEEGAVSRAGGAAYELLTFDRLISSDDTIASMSAVTHEDVRAVAQAALDANPVYSCVGPAAGRRAVERRAAGCKPS